MFFVLFIEFFPHVCPSVLCWSDKWRTAGDYCNKFGWDPFLQWHPTHFVKRFDASKKTAWNAWPKLQSLLQSLPKKIPKTLYPWFKRNFFLQWSPNLRQEFWRCKHRRTLHQAKKAGPRRFWSGTERQIKRKDLKIRRSSLWRKVKFSTEHSHQVKIIL